MVTTGLAMLAGEVTTNAHVDYTATARKAIIEVGYDDAAYGYDGKTCSVISTITPSLPTSRWASIPGEPAIRG